MDNNEFNPFSGIVSHAAMAAWVETNTRQKAEARARRQKAEKEMAKIALLSHEARLAVVRYLYRRELLLDANVPNLPEEARFNDMVAEIEAVTATIPLRALRPFFKLVRTWKLSKGYGGVPSTWHYEHCADLVKSGDLRFHVAEHLDSSAPLSLLPSSQDMAIAMLPHVRTLAVALVKTGRIHPDNVRHILGAPKAPRKAPRKALPQQAEK